MFFKFQVKPTVIKFLSLQAPIAKSKTVNDFKRFWALSKILERIY